MANKKDAYYFPHDSNAKDDPKCLFLIEQLGLEGYGIFWVLVEILRDEPSHKYPMKLIPSIARKYNTTAAKVKAVVRGYELFTTDEDNFFFSQSLINRMAIVDAKRQALSEAGKKGNNKRWKRPLAVPSPPDRHPIASKEKDSKTEQSKQESITHTPNSHFDHETILKATLYDDAFMSETAEVLRVTIEAFRAFCKKKLAAMKISGQSVKYPLGTIKKILLEDYCEQGSKESKATIYVPPTAKSKQYFNPSTKNK